MRKIDDIPKIKVEPRNDTNVATAAHRPGDTVRLSDSELGIHPRSEDTRTGFKMDPIEEQYTILDKVGDGGMGIVYLAQDKKLGRYVAIKRLNRSSLSNPVLKERFYREAKSVAALNHIHIVHVYGIGDDSEGPYIVMEYVPGPPETSPDKTPHLPFTLADRVEHSGPLSMDDALGLLLKICKAIEYAHNCGVIHRDLKPSNVLIDESGEPKLADFGLARRIGQGEEHLTVPGEKMLSVGYGAPEQESDASQTDQRADVYGLGAILYFSITGRNPRYFRESEVPESIRMPLVKALETDREKRWNTVKEFTSALLLIKSPSTIEIPTVKTTWRCKWCDTLNPVTISYCGKCGWDGGETCAECGADTRVGIQFCGACGADAREYEMAQLLLKRMQRHWDEKTFELVIHEASRSVRFQPTGINGRKLLNRIEAMGREAQRSIHRRREIKEAIEREKPLENYELIKKYIEEYNTIANDHAFADLSRELPALIVSGNLKKIRRAIDNQEWNYAERACRDIIDSKSGNSSEAEILIRIIKFQKARLQIIKIAALFLFMLFIYVLSAAPAYYYLGRTSSQGFKSFYRLANYFHESSILRSPLEKYAQLWGVVNIYDKPAEKDVPNPATTVKIGDIISYQTEYAEALKKLEKDNEARVKTWQRNYMTELAALQTAMQKKGDFEGWSAVRDERSRLEDNPTIPEDALLASPQELVALQYKFRDNEFKVIAEKKKEARALTLRYEEKLENLQKKMTMQGRMEDAAAINLEIKKIKTSLEAEPGDMRTPLQQTKSTVQK